MTHVLASVENLPRGLDEAQRNAHWMRCALDLAASAAAQSEVPVGAVVVCGDQIVGRGANAAIASNDPTAHAEIVALRDAARHLGNYRLQDCELFVTLEPCVMCSGAMLHARLKRVVYGAADPKTGAAGSVIDVFANQAINHHTQVMGGVLKNACAHTLQDFFSRQRQRQSLEKQQAGRALRDDALRTPESRFAAFSAAPEVTFYVHDLAALNGLRLHYIDTGPLDTDSASLYLHGGTDWSYAWHQQIKLAKQRVICPDLIGFGKSDKPKKASAHSLQWHAQCVAQLIERLGLQHVSLFLPPQSAALAQHLMALAEGIITQVTFQQPGALTPEALAAPFPDEGHRAALRAFSANVGHL